MMNPKVKKRWIEALRSGKFRQSRGSLMGKFGYCCLGVLCEVEKLPYNGDKGMPPGKSLDAVELDSYNADKLADYNDRSKRNFKWIADWIERNL